ncbi:MAG: uncharacterized protein KVP18_003743 [Porospora cf. gigantea A]|uniref:uncharacterized protein n=1 Tax=Porospora cf. gigantea A TaxID=2853593 RepID=UPI00355A442B|nr:MAG: hypothetical protein KVP18_003743 [Porospora cf. gigantea A]
MPVIARLLQSSVGFLDNAAVHPVISALVRDLIFVEQVSEEPVFCGAWREFFEVADVVCRGVSLESTDRFLEEQCFYVDFGLEAIRVPLPGASGGEARVREILHRLRTPIRGVSGFDVLHNLLVAGLQSLAEGAFQDCPAKADVLSALFLLCRLAGFHPLVRVALDRMFGGVDIVAAVRIVGDEVHPNSPTAYYLFEFLKLMCTYDNRGDSYQWSRTEIIKSLTVMAEPFSAGDFRLLLQGHTLMLTPSQGVLRDPVCNRWVLISHLEQVESPDRFWASLVDLMLCGVSGQGPLFFLKFLKTMLGTNVHLLHAGWARHLTLSMSSLVVSVAENAQDPHRGKTPDVPSSISPVMQYIQASTPPQHLSAAGRVHTTFIKAVTRALSQAFSFRVSGICTAFEDQLAWDAAYLDVVEILLTHLVNFERVLTSFDLRDSELLLSFGGDSLPATSDRATLLLECNSILNFIGESRLIDFLLTINAVSASFEENSVLWSSTLLVQLTESRPTWRRVTSYEAADLFSFIPGHRQASRLRTSALGVLRLLASALIGSETFLLDKLREQFIPGIQNWQRLHSFTRQPGIEYYDMNLSGYQMIEPELPGLTLGIVVPPIQGLAVLTSHPTLRPLAFDVLSCLVVLGRRSSHFDLRLELVNVSSRVSKEHLAIMQKSLLEDILKHHAVSSAPNLPEASSFLLVAANSQPQFMRSDGLTWAEALLGHLETAAHPQEHLETASHPQEHDDLLTLPWTSDSFALKLACYALTTILDTLQWSRRTQRHNDILTRCMRLSRQLEACQDMLTLQIHLTVLTLSLGDETPDAEWTSYLETTLFDCAEAVSATTDSRKQDLAWWYSCVASESLPRSLLLGRRGVEMGRLLPTGTKHTLVVEAPMEPTGAPMTLLSVPAVVDCAGRGHCDKLRLNNVMKPLLDCCNTLFGTPVSWLSERTPPSVRSHLTVGSPHDRFGPQYVVAVEEGLCLIEAYAGWSPDTCNELHVGAVLGSLPITAKLDVYSHLLTRLSETFALSDYFSFMVIALNTLMCTHTDIVLRAAPAACDCILQSCSQRVQSLPSPLGLADMQCCSLLTSLIPRLKNDALGLFAPLCRILAASVSVLENGTPNLQFQKRQLEALRVDALGASKLQDDVRRRDVPVLLAADFLAFMDDFFCGKADLVSVAFMRSDRLDLELAMEILLSIQLLTLVLGKSPRIAAGTEEALKRILLTCISACKRTQQQAHVLAHATKFECSHFYKFYFGPEGASGGILPVISILLPQYAMFLLSSLRSFVPNVKLRMADMLAAYLQSLPPIPSLQLIGLRNTEQHSNFVREIASDRRFLALSDLAEDVALGNDVPPYLVNRPTHFPMQGAMIHERALQVQAVSLVLLEVHSMAKAETVDKNIINAIVRAHPCESFLSPLGLLHSNQHTWKVAYVPNLWRSAYEIIGPPTDIDEGVIRRSAEHVVFLRFLYVLRDVLDAVDAAAILDFLRPRLLYTFTNLREVSQLAILEECAASVGVLHGLCKLKNLSASTQNQLAELLLCLLSSFKSVFASMENAADFPVDVHDIIQPKSLEEVWASKEETASLFYQRVLLLFLRSLPLVLSSLSRIDLPSLLLSDESRKHLADVLTVSSGLKSAESTWAGVDGLCHLLYDFTRNLLRFNDDLCRATNIFAGVEQLTVPTCIDLGGYRSPFLVKPSENNLTRGLQLPTSFHCKLMDPAPALSSSGPKRTLLHNVRRFKSVKIQPEPVPIQHLPAFVTVEQVTRWASLGVELMVDLGYAALRHHTNVFPSPHPSVTGVRVSRVTELAGIVNTFAGPDSACLPRIAAKIDALTARLVSLEKPGSSVCDVT